MPAMVAHIATDTALDRTFDYLVPDELAAKVAPGMRVRVSFGRRTLEGTVLGLAETSAFPNLKPILEVVGDHPFIAPQLLDLARWMAAYYLAPIELALNALLPAPVRRQGGTPARERFVVEIVPAKERPNPLPALTSRQAEVLACIERGGDGFLNGICQQWHVTPALVRKVADLGYLRIVTRTERRNPMTNRRVLPTQPLALSDEQRGALESILSTVGSPDPRPVLLYGVTASGKTEVYLQAIASVLAEGRGAIVLVPEIALTPQTIQRFAGRFGERVAVLHSQLSDGERHDEWHRIRSGEARVVVGPRSAVFAPVDKLGILIVDEEHEPSYKQEEAPRYHARDVAVMRGHIEKCTVVLGSATPSLESWHNVSLGKYALARMRTRIPGVQPPNTIIVDMRSDGQRDGIPQVFSRALVDAIQRRLQLGEQTMLFLNRRGYAPTMVCPTCAHVETCHDCSLAMTYHLGDNILRCHLCSAFRPPPTTCPKCGDPGIRHRGIGTQRVEVIAAKLFPQAKVERMDADVTTRKHSHEEILARFRGGQVDILIGTQMIAKGLDFPNVTLVGVLNADAGLFIPDFRASERTFQLIAQMSGRSGRGSVAGEVMVQTSSPAHPAIACARTEDFEAFATGELQDRRELAFPPFSRLVCVTFRGADERAVEAYARTFAAALGNGGGAFHVCDPTAAPISRMKTLFRHQIVARTAALRPLLSALRRALLATPPPNGVQVAVDVDALSLL
jgi:primosomal protein N' (replication factor Y)